MLKSKSGVEEVAMQAAADAPIACTLGRTALGERLGWIQRVTTQNLLDHELRDSTLRLSYRLDAIPDLERIVAAERECCSFLSYSLEATKGAAVLTIVAPSGVGPEARWLFDQFLPQPASPAPTKSCGCGPGACG